MISRLDPDRAVGEWVHEHSQEFDELYFAARAQLTDPSAPLDPELFADLIAAIRTEILRKIQAENTQSHVFS